LQSHQSRQTRGDPSHEGIGYTFVSDPSRVQRAEDALFGFSIGWMRPFSAMALVMIVDPAIIAASDTYLGLLASCRPLSTTGADLASGNHG
jgi:hypothetical protein